jgi:hypothetical protein
MRRGVRFPQWWMAVQPGVGESVETLVCDGKTLRGSIAQNTYATDSGSESSALRELLDRADALHANRPFFSTSSSVAPTSSRRKSFA